MPVPPGPVADPCIDPTMPGEAAEVARGLLDSPKATPEELNEAADVADEHGWPKAAKCLRKKADAIEAKQAMKPTKWKLRDGDLAYNMARGMTGDGNRWKEIVAANAHINMRVVNKQPSPWYTGLIIRLPAGWDPKKIPLPASGSLPAPAPKDSPVSSPPPDSPVATKDSPLKGTSAYAHGSSADQALVPVKKGK